MKLSKNEFKKLAKTATKITNQEKYTTTGNVTFVEDSVISYREMHMLLMQCSRWSADRYENKIFATGTICSFTVEL